MSWVVAAFASAFFAGITSILAKCGIKQTDSDVATAIRTCVVLVFAWQWRAFLDPLEPLAASNPDPGSFSSSRDSLPVLRDLLL